MKRYVFDDIEQYMYYSKFDTNKARSIFVSTLDYLFAIGYIILFSKKMPRYD